MRDDTGIRQKINLVNSIKVTDQFWTLNTLLTGFLAEALLTSIFMPSLLNERSYNYSEKFFTLLIEHELIGICTCIDYFNLWNPGRYISQGNPAYFRNFGVLLSFVLQLFFFLLYYIILYIFKYLFIFIFIYINICFYIYIISILYVYKYRKK